MQVGTATFADPTLAGRMVDELPGKLAKAVVSHVNKFIGTLRSNKGSAAMNWLLLVMSALWVVGLVNGTVYLYRRGSSLGRAKRRLHRAGLAVFLGSVINFALFWLVAGRIGGDAVSGEKEDGRFYVSNHGERTEVSESTYMYSYAHLVSVCITGPLGLLCFLAMLRVERTGSGRA